MTARLDRRRLDLVLPRLGSPFDGEALTAARLANKMVRDAGLTWPDVLQPPLPTPRSDTPPFGDHGEIQFCLRYWCDLGEWERGFVASVRDRRHPLTTRQRNCLARIVDRLRARAEAA